MRRYPCYVIDRVEVAIHNNEVLTIRIFNSPANSKLAENRALIAQRAAVTAYETYSSRDRLEVVNVELRASERKFLIVRVESSVDSFSYRSAELVKHLPDDLSEPILDQ